MAEVKLRALGLREIDFGDYDRYLTALTEDGRKIEILCKNVRRGGKKQISAARQFCFSEFCLSARGERYTLREADLVRQFWALTQDVEAYALACYLAELTAALTDAGEDSPQACRLLLTALHALAEKKRDGRLVKAAFEWRMLAQSGYAPDLSCCAVCGKPIAAPPVLFSVRAGTAACAACGARVGAGYAPLEEGALRALVHTLSAEVPRVFAFALSGAAAAQFCTLGEQFALHHLARGFDSLTFYHSVCAMARPTIERKQVSEQQHE